MPLKTTPAPSDATPKRRLHPFAKWSVLLIGISLLLPFTRLAPALACVPLCWVMAVMLGMETFIKYRWPGDTATERARRPTSRDLWFATLGIVLGATGLGLMAFADVLF